MYTVWKVHFNLQDTQALALPIGSRMLSVGMQHDVPCLWALVDDAAPIRARTIEVYGTGHPMRAVLGARFIGTLLLQDGMVFHVFEGPVGGGNG